VAAAAAPEALEANVQSLPQVTEPQSLASEQAQGNEKEQGHDNGREKEHTPEETVDGLPQVAISPGFIAVNDKV
jgi:hypothetical protein